MTPRVAATLIVLAVAICYGNTLANDWVWDDASSVLLHRHVQDPSRVLQLFAEDQHAFGRGEGNFYRPLVSISFMIDYVLSGMPQAASPNAIPDIPTFQFHLSNMLWHAAAACALLALLVRMGAPALVWISVPLVYAVHPLHTEAVAYISGRADMLMATFLYLAGWTAVASTEAKSLTRHVLLSAATAGFGLLALLSKESALVLPFFVALVLWASPARASLASKLQAAWWQPWVPAAASLGLVLIYAVLRSSILQYGDTTAADSPDASARILVEATQALARYASLLVWPTGLHMERTLAGAGTVDVLGGLAAIAALVGGLGLALRNGQTRIAMGIGWFVLTWLPISGIFPLNAPMAEHWMYLPMAGLFWAIAETVALAADQPAVRSSFAIVVAVALVAFSGLTIARNRDWVSNERLYEATIQYNPASYRVHYNLAVTYEDIVDNLSGARRHYQQALALLGPVAAEPGPEAPPLREDQAEILLSLGRVHMQLGNYDAAFEAFRRVAAASNASSEGMRPMALVAQIGVGESLLASGNLSGGMQVLGGVAQQSREAAPNVQRILDGGPFPSRP